MHLAYSSPVHILIASLFFTVLFSCQQGDTDTKEDRKDHSASNTKNAAIARADYAMYLQPKNNNELEKQQKEYAFWEAKIEKTPGQFPWLVKMAIAANKLFDITGDVKYLNLANDHLESTNKINNRSSSDNLRSLARCYITQHRFKDSHQALLDAEELGEKIDETNKMLFDVNMELGDYETAETYLNKIKEKSSFDHLIRKSKWEDHNGNLDKAITYMESALKNAKLQKNATLTLWSYTNLADYYGHAGRIEDSYNNYLKALAINPNDAYAMKGIAWILYSHQKDTAGAKEILNALIKRHDSPDYFLLRSEIAEYEGNEAEKNKWLDMYLEKINNPEYGVMYNKYKIELLAEEKGDFQTAKQLAKDEIEMRPTPQSYDLLAWATLKAGEKKEALSIIERHVVNKSFEPALLYHTAEIYKANGNKKKVDEFKPELLESVYELGPVMGKRIELL